MERGTGISFNALFNNASIGIIVADQAGKIVLANPFLLDQFGYAAEELFDVGIEKLIPSRFHSRHTHRVKKYNEHPKSRPMGMGMDLFAIRRDGSEFPLEVSLGSYETDHGKFVIAFLSDISKRKEAEHALKQLNEDLEKRINDRTQSLTSTVKQLAQLVAETEAKDVELSRVNSFLGNIWNHAEVIIFVTDREGTLKMFNPTAEKLLGYTAEEIVNIHNPVLFLDESELILKAEEASKELKIPVPFDFSAIKIRTDMGLPNEQESTYVRKDGSRFAVLLTITGIRDNSGAIEYYLGVANDISERKKADADLRLALAKEKELSELKSRFVSLASHEFRTPLSTVLSSAYLISQYTDEEGQPKRERHVQRIVSAVNMLTDILNDFLSVGKIEEGKIQVRFTTFNIQSKLQDIISELQGLLKMDQRITLVHEGTEMVHLDPSLIKHIIINLVSNAIKFSAEGSEILIQTKKDQELVRISVTDTGLGISEEDQEHLFERFYRGANVNHIQGTGLGLHIVDKYVELMNGRIDCNSVLGRGTTFEIVFESNESHT
jgi:PAS domain S-box-containing protein